MTEVLDTLYKSLGKFITPQNLEQTYKTLIEEGSRLSGAKGGTIYLRDNGDFYIAYSSIHARKYFKPRREGFAYQAYQTKKIVIASKNEVVKAHPEIKKKNISFLAFIPLSYGKRSIGVLVLQFEDVTELSEEKLKILQIFGSIASLVIRKMQDFEKTKSALESRDLFISLASHELKTPLTAIQICTNLLNQNIKDKESVLRNLKDSTSRLNNLVNDFIHLDQIKKKELKYEFKNEGLVSILTKLIETHKLVNPKTPITLLNNIVGNDIVRVDSFKLSQAFSNLINNSIKFSLENSPIEIILNQERDFLVVTFTDHGIGMTKETVDQLFEKFFKGSSKKKGMGLGLYLTKEIIEKHNGQIKVNSAINKGTIITIRLPEQKS